MMTNKDYGRSGLVSGRPSCFLLDADARFDSQSQSPASLSVNLVALDEQKRIARAILQLEAKRQGIERQVQALRRLQGRRVS